MHNTFTYRHSDLPPIRPQIQAEIVALDVQIADLILKSQGNYRELQQLAEVLDNCLDGCELNLNSIQIVADGSSQPPIGMMDLPMEEKQIIFSTALTSSIAIESLASIFGKSPQQIANELSEKAQEFTETVTSGKVNAVIEELLRVWRKEPGQTVYRIEVDS
ncbi:hypothetical protein E5S67_06226 [Microcoleus sp. IPMA8]|uniref:Uncharacterized protein n=2 Tax=Microcoleus TaxID=44471 RepID=A0ABX2D701_9CYAN|nr:hypothetical protein [Microcoleus asticus IPMA8]